MTVLIASEQIDVNLTKINDNLLRMCLISIKISILSTTKYFFLV
jgi:hypothetical protein